MFDMLGFAPFTLEPGASRTAIRTVDPVLGFKPVRLIIAGWMDVIRGHFRVKGWRRGVAVSREDVYAYSTLPKDRKRARTILKVDSGDKRFERKYLPSSVVYLPVDPLSYITLDQIKTDDFGNMPEMAAGISATLFGVGKFGNQIPLGTARREIRVSFTNIGDIPIKVVLSMVGYARHKDKV